VTIHLPTYTCRSRMVKTPPDATDAIGGQADIDERKPPPSVASAAFNWFESDVEREEAVVELRLPVMPIRNEAIGRITIFPRIEQTEDRQYTKNAQLECVAGPASKPTFDRSLMMRRIIVARSPSTTWQEAT
jgi:hypothetical protein